MHRSSRDIPSIVLLVSAVVATGHAAELQTRTIEAFDRYVAATEVRMATERGGDTAFLWMDRQPEAARRDAERRLRAGEVLTDRLETRDADGDDIAIPKGMVHHWIGTVLIPGVTLDETMTMVQDYERYAEIYAPNVRRSSLLGREGHRYRSSLQLYMKKVVSVVLNTEYDIEFQLLDDRRAWVPSYATRIVEVEHPDTPDEREKPVGSDRGFLWRLNTYCSFAERESDTYMQCESVSLTRGIPFILSAFIRPFVTGIPKDTLTFTLAAARRYLTDSADSPIG